MCVCACRSLCASAHTYLLHAAVMGRGGGDAARGLGGHLGRWAVLPDGRWCHGDGEARDAVQAGPLLLQVLGTSDCRVGTSLPILVTQLHSQACRCAATGGGTPTPTFPVRRGPAPPMTGGTICTPTWNTSQAMVTLQPPHEYWHLPVGLSM